MRESAGSGEIELNRDRNRLAQTGTGLQAYFLFSLASFFLAAPLPDAALLSRSAIF
jgi:hypothetical protein